mgnify:CR=1 FL=1
MVAHYIACINNYVIQQEIRVYKITTPELIDQEAFSEYIYSMYWSVTTMITVGYGDITPRTTNQKIYSVLAMLIASAVFGYVMNRIGVIFQRYGITNLHIFIGFMRFPRSTR